MKIVNLISKKVLCDLCGEDFTFSTEKGGLLFNSNAVCPRCKPNFEKLIKECKEEHYIKDRAVANETFAEFVIRVRSCGCYALN